MSDYDQQMQLIIERAGAASEIMKQFSNGPDNAFVQTDSGPIPTLANWLKSVATGIPQLQDQVVALESLVSRFSSTQQGDGATLIAYGNRNVGAKLNELRTIMDFGAVCDGITDDSAAARAMLAETNMIIVPDGRACALKNIEMTAGAKVSAPRSTLRLLGGAADNDRVFFGVDKPGLQIHIGELDGNSASQSGAIATHLLYFVRCSDSRFKVDYVHDHYARNNAPMPSTDGLRNASTGCLWFYQCHRSDVDVGLLRGWGREGVYLEQCDFSSATLGHAQGISFDEYSGLQVKGNNSAIHRASVDNAGASGVGFDVINGTLSNVISTNTRENHGVNFGHIGFPATGSVAQNIVVDGAMRNGVSVGASTQDLTIDGFSIRNAGEGGINVSDGVLRAKLSNGVVENSGLANLQVSVAQVDARNIRNTPVDARSISISAASGTFTPGETVTQGSISGVVRKAIKNLTGANQVLFLQSATGAFTNGQVITGASSGASGTIESSASPLPQSATSGGQIISGGASSTSGALGRTVKFEDGTMIHTHTVGVTTSNPAAASEVITQFPDDAGFIAKPTTQCSIGAPSTTNTFTVQKLQVTSSATGYTLAVQASVNQTYSIDVTSIGRWKA